MPTYDYDCTACGAFEAYRSMTRRNEPAPCPRCNALAARVWLSAARLALLNDDTRAAMDVNERARNAPQRSSDYVRLRHPAGCGCCQTGLKRGATVKAPNGAKAFPSKRPWMISH